MKVSKLGLLALANMISSIPTPQFDIDAVSLASRLSGAFSLQSTSNGASVTSASSIVAQSSAQQTTFQTVASSIGTTKSAQNASQSTVSAASLIIQSVSKTGIDAIILAAQITSSSTSDTAIQASQTNNQSTAVPGATAATSTASDASTTADQQTTETAAQSATLSSSSIASVQGATQSPHSSSSAAGTSVPFSQLSILPTAAVASLSASTSKGPAATQVVASGSSTLSSNRLSAGGITAAVFMSIAVLAVVLFMVWKFCSPIKRRRKKSEKAYLPDRDYFSRRSIHEVPMIDKGLGLTYHREENAPSNRRSFTDLLAQRQSQIQRPRPQTTIIPQQVFRSLSGRSKHTIRRKPVPPLVEIPTLSNETGSRYPLFESMNIDRHLDNRLIGIAVPLGTKAISTSTSMSHLVDKDLPMTPDEQRVLQNGGS